MAITIYVPNHFFYMLATKEIDFENDVFKAILMNTTYTPDIDADATLASITSDQLSTANGYTQDNYTLANVAVTENDSTDKCTITWNAPTWTASGGDIGPTGAMVVYDDTTGDDTVCFIVDYGTDYTVVAGASLQFTSPGVDIAQGS